MPEERSYFGIGDMRDVAGQIMPERAVGERCVMEPSVARSSVNGCSRRGLLVVVYDERNGYWGRKRQIFDIRADHQRPLPGLRAPGSGCSIVMPEGVAVESDVHNLAFVSAKADFPEAFEFARGPQHAACRPGRTGNVELRDGRTRDVGIVGHHEAHTALVHTVLVHTVFINAVPINA